MYKVRATYLPKEDMTFDLDYYFRVHVPLAQKQGAGRINIVKIDVESDTELLMAPGVKRTPCVFSIYFNDEEDVNAFRAFMASDAVKPMREDVANYTNCEIEWTVCEVTEA